MEIGDDKAEENARFAFLLGSALRNEDADQFLQVYDAIIPRNFPPEKVNMADIRPDIHPRRWEFSLGDMASVDWFRKVVFWFWGSCLPADDDISKMIIRKK